MLKLIIDQNDIFYFNKMEHSESKKLPLYINHLGLIKICSAFFSKTFYSYKIISLLSHQCIIAIIFYILYENL